jgi:hypothetical protein
MFPGKSYMMVLVDGLFPKRRAILSVIEGGEAMR